MNSTHSYCTLCNSDLLKPLKVYRKHNLVKCKSCGFVFCQKIPDTNELENYYKNYSYWREQFLSPITIKRYHQIIDKFEKHRKNNNLLDIGCGMGFFLEIAAKRGWKTYGLEYSDTAIKICSEKGIIMHKSGEVPDLFGNLEFDIVTSFETIEHLIYPDEHIKMMYRFLRTGGLAYCTTPNYNGVFRYIQKDKYDIIGYPEHLCYFTPQTFNAILKKNNFKIQSINTTGVSFTRLRNSIGVTYQANVSNSSDDEKIRTAIEKNYLLLFGKKIINFIFSITGTGMSLKVFFNKKQEF